MPDHEKRDLPVARAIWSGSITFGLVSIPVELFSAHRRGRPSLRMLGPDGTPLARQYVSSKTGKALSNEDLVRGYEVEDGKFLVVTDKDLEKLAPRKSRDIELLRFVKREEIDPAYYIQAYFLLPGSGQARAYGLLATTMEESGRAGIGTFVMRERAYAAAIWAESGLLRAATLRFHDQVRSLEEIGLPDLPKPKAAAVRRFATAIGKLTEKAISEKEFQDEEVETILDLARRKYKKGEDVVETAVPEEKTATETSVIDLMAELQKRMKQRAGTPVRRKGRAGATSSRR